MVAEDVSLAPVDEPGTADLAKQAVGGGLLLTVLAGHGLSAERFARPDDITLSEGSVSRRHSGGTCAIRLACCAGSRHNFTAFAR
jgi:hypothetical protein